MTNIDPNELRELADDPKLVEEVRLELEKTLIEMRDHNMFAACRNGLAITDMDGKPNGIIRVGTGRAIQMALRTMANKMEAAG